MCVSDLVKMDGTVNAENCLIFQHDNDPKQTVRAVKAYLARKAHNGTLTHGSALPELNIIETVRDHLDREKQSFKCPSKSLKIA